ncbi:hypothetical protein GGQ16_001227 [Salinibacter ruber]|nr:hypothetical protein [Salinibacter ruber]
MARYSELHSFANNPSSGGFFGFKWLFEAHRFNGSPAGLKWRAPPFTGTQLYHNHFYCQFCYGRLFYRRSCKR